MQSISNWFTKNSMITSFIVCSIFLSVLCFTPLTFAQPVFDRSDGSTVVVPMNVDVLWDQSDNESDTDIVSQDFIDVIFDTFDARAADDFLVPDGYLWLIDTVKVFGTFDGAAPDAIQSLDVVFYRDEDGFPGPIVNSCNYLNILPLDIDDPSFLINLPSTCTLRPGTYWISVRANMLFNPHGQWFWNERTVQTLNPFVWENPGNGFGTGCISYRYAQAECGSDFPDLTFQLVGQEQVFPAVPALSTLGLIILSIAFGFILVTRYRKVNKLERMKN